MCVYERVKLRSVKLSLNSKHSRGKQNRRWNYYCAYYWVTVGFVQMIRNWHVSSSRQDISFVGRVCVHRQWQSQMSHQHCRSSFLFNPKHVGENWARAKIILCPMPDGQSLVWLGWVTSISGKAPLNSVICYRQHCDNYANITFVSKISPPVCRHWITADQSEE